MAVLSREAFDALEFDAACTGDHQSAALEMTRLADTATRSDSMARSEAYIRAGEEWLLADDPRAAAHAFERAIADGGPASTDPRVPLARAMFLLGRTDQAESLIGELAAQPPTDPRICDQVAELLVERSELAKALVWATAGVDLCLGGRPPAVAAGQAGQEQAATGRAAPGPGSDAGTGPGGEENEPRLTLPEGGDRTELRLLLTLRYRIRNDLGLPEDRYDRLLDQLPSGAG